MFILASNIIGIDVIDKFWRFEMKVGILKLRDVGLYNIGMSGIDMLNQVLRYYRIFIKSKK